MKGDCLRFSVIEWKGAVADDFRLLIELDRLVLETDAIGRHDKDMSKTKSHEKDSYAQGMT